MVKQLLRLAVEEQVLLSLAHKRRALDLFRDAVAEVIGLRCCQIRTWRGCACRIHSLREGPPRHAARLHHLLEPCIELRGGGHRKCRFHLRSQRGGDARQLCGAVVVDTVVRDAGVTGSQRALLR